MATITTNNMTKFLHSLTLEMINDARWWDTDTGAQHFVKELLIAYWGAENGNFTISDTSYSVTSHSETQVDITNNTSWDTLVMKGISLSDASLVEVSSLTISGATDIIFFTNDGFFSAESYNLGTYQKFTLTSQEGLHIDSSQATGTINALTYNQRQYQNKEINHESYGAKNIKMVSILPELLTYSVSNYDDAELETLINGAFGNKMISLLLKGNDTIKGTTGNDLLMGGLGKDKLTGGAGNDTFIYQSLRDSSILTTKMDTITDFTSGKDKIDLSALDANTVTKSTNNAFTGFIDASATFTTAGQLKLVSGVLYGNTDKDESAEFAIALTGINSLSMNDIIA